MAARRIKYQKGDSIGKHNIIFLSDIKDKYKGRRALFKCHCGKEFEYNLSKIKFNRINHCGCAPKNKESIKKGTLFGKYNNIYIKDIEYKKQRRAKFKCICGNFFTARISNVKNNSVKSCGCLILKTITTHGLSKHPLYLTHFGMVDRCHNPNSTNSKNYYYKDRKVEKYLKNLKNFIFYFESEIGPFDIKTRKFIRPKNWSIDRINNNLGYIKGNIKWSTIYEQSANRNTNHFYVGVEINKNKFVSYIRYKTKYYHLGSFKTADLALTARNTFIIKNKFPHQIQILKQYKNE